MEERRFWSMGTICHIVIDSARPGLAAGAVDHLEGLERRWSRFIGDSDLVRINRAGAGTTTVAPETAELIQRACLGWEWSGGRFDPTVLDSLVALGYDRTFESLAGRVATRTEPGAPAPGCDSIEVDIDRCTVRLEEGQHLDLGGIAKGRAADMTAEWLLSHGVRAGLVSVGGDLRVAGRRGDRPWQVSILDPFDTDHALCTLALETGALATSSTRRRRWATTEGQAHHLIDPRTGNPAQSGLSAVSVIAGEASWAEIAAKAALLAGLEEGVSLVEGAGLAAAFVDDGGTVFATESLCRHLVSDEELILL
ncbi:MAG: FAD:protein FMN transferase [Acidimicrobiales bacterium]|nr:MAG: FAD:protein FMN transferase [Actinomycetota bacterium]MBV6508964.1 FAD:protein FMN transferase [Acidimicrobiales bacterium]RIK08400.1 MAG: FAD:protein FMN transferase [Acidobacteriota bacterium]